MAKILKSVPNAVRLHGNAHYDWDVIFDGKIRQFYRGEDFSTTKGSFLNLARITARKRGIDITSGYVGDDSVIIKANL